MKKECKIGFILWLVLIVTSFLASADVSAKERYPIDVLAVYRDY